MVAATLTQGSISRHLMHMALPMIWGLLANMSIQVIDTLFIAQLGEKPLAAMGFVFPVSMIYLSLSIGLSAGASSVIARKIPSGDKPGLRLLVTHTQLLSLMIAITAACIGWLTVEPLFRVLGAPDDLLPLIKSYIHIYYLTFIFVMVGMTGLSSVRATGNARLQGNAMMLGAVVNAIVDPLLIFGLFGFPRLEIQGAALASLIARMVTFAVGYYFLIREIRLMVWPGLRISAWWPNWRHILHIALPAMATNMIIPVSAAIITALLATYGVDAVAGAGVAGRLEPLMLIAFYSLSAVIGPFVGQNLSVGRFDRVQAGVKLAGKFALFTGLSTAVVMWLVAKPLARLFSEVTDVVEVATAYLTLVPISYGCAGVVMIVNASFNGMGKPLPATLISLLRVLVLYVPLAYLGSYLYGYRGIFVAYALVNVISAVIAYLWFLKVASQLPLSPAHRA